MGAGMGEVIFRKVARPVPGGRLAMASRRWGLAVLITSLLWLALVELVLILLH